MAPMATKMIEHFTHPNHQLLEIKNDEEYLCNGCNTFGIGTRFRCHGCNFDLHEDCATCPMSLSSFMHSQHQLNLVVRKPEATRQNERICDVCRDKVEGLFYRCKLCEFDVHPLCTKLPQQVQFFLHPAHPLTLQPFSSSRCLVCKNDCTSWRYRCGICCIDIHLECLLTACDALTLKSMPPPRSVGQPRAPAAVPPPAFGAYGYQVPPFGNAYAYGVQAPPVFGAYGYQVPPFGNAYAYGVQAPPAFGDYGYQIPPFGNAYAHGVQAPPVGAYNYQYGAPFGPSPTNMYHHQVPSGNQQVGGGRFRQRMYKILGALSLGVFSNVVSNALLGD